jgi:hypothetical protein
MGVVSWPRGIGWSSCTTLHTRSRPVPEYWVEKEGKHCILLRDYTATEPSAEEGEAATTEFPGSGWG